MYIFISHIDVHTFACVKAKEDYEGLAEEYERCFESINEILKSQKSENKYTLEYFYVVTIK